jgi:hypothetical protein
MMADPMDNAMDKMSVVPGAPEDEGKPAPVLQADAGTDESIARRLYKNPDSKEARLDRGLDESMDASDPPASTQPGHLDELPVSSGYDEKAEKKLAKGEPDTLLGKIAAKLGLD